MAEHYCLLLHWYCTFLLVTVVEISNFATFYFAKLPLLVTWTLFHLSDWCRESLLLFNVFLCNYGSQGIAPFYYFAWGSLLLITFH